MFVFLKNTPLNSIDILGLGQLEFVFYQQRNEGSWTASILGGIGEWGQPGYNASGSYSETPGNIASSTVTIKGSFFGRVNCNTVLDKNDAPADAGQLWIYANNGTPGVYIVRLKVKTTLTTTPVASDSVPKASINAYVGGNKVISGTSVKGSFSKEETVDVEVTIKSKDEVIELGTIKPTVGVVGCKGSATAVGTITVIEYKPKAP